MKHKILVVDDDPVILNLIQAVLGTQDLQIISTSDSNEALAIFLEDPTLVVLSDLNMPGMTGTELMLKIFESGNTPVFIMLTAETDVKKVVELFKLGIHDYIVKPFNSSELISRVEKAYEFAELQIINRNIQKERDIRIEHQLNWNLFKENLIKKDSDKSDSSLMANINTSLIQGAGLGTLSPLVDMIKESSRLEGDHYIVEKDMLDMLFDNSQFSNKLIFAIGNIDYVINSELPKLPCSITQVYAIIENAIKDLLEFQKLKNNIVILAKNTFGNNSKILNINEEYFKKAIEELLLNAYKFSEAGSKIYILFEILKNSFQISFLNTPEKNTKEENGIPPEYQTIIFEPFFRISRLVYDNYGSLDFGLGLCLVEKIIRNHKGTIRVLNLKNYIEKTNQILIDFQMEIPFAN